METAEELARDERAKRRQIREDAELFGALLAHRGWGRYMALVEAVAQNHYAAVMRPLESVLEVTKIEHAKGVLSGLSLATSLPQMKIRESQELARHTDEE